MEKAPYYIEDLIIQYLRGDDMTPAGAAALAEWRSRSAEHQQLPDQFKDPAWVARNLLRIRQIPSLAMWEKIDKSLQRDQNKDC